MDTRSVVRSRRRSTRLTGQPPQEDRVKWPTTGKRRDSSHDTSVNSSSNASREPSCPPADPNPKDASLGHDIHAASHDSKTAKASAQDEDNGTRLPLFPNLRSSKAKAPGTPIAETDSIIAPPREPVDSSSEKAVKGHVSTKWVKTAKGSIRLASDSPAEYSKTGEAHEGQNASSATSRRRSRRLTCMVPDVGHELDEIKPLHSQRLMEIKAEAPARFVVGSDKLQEPEPDLQDHLTKARAEPGPSTHDDLPTHDGKRDPFPKHDVQQDTSPIPELLADIERIIQSSPLADRNPTDDVTEGTTASVTEGTTASTLTHSFKKPAPANVLTRSRALRSSTRSIDKTGEIGKTLGFERTDSDSSQFDGAFDDIIRGQRRKKTQVECGTANTAKPRRARGIKRSVQELSEAEGLADSPSVRQRRKPDSDGSKPRVDLSSFNPIEAATSRNAFSADKRSVGNTLDTSELPRKTTEPANPDVRAEMISANPERADDVNDTTPAGDDSHGRSQLQNHGEDTHKCADCGKVPEWYLVCAKCQKAIYCGKYCQIWNWPLHKTSCHASDEAVQAEVELQEAYLGDMWTAALKVLKEENRAGGTVESLLLGEAVRHSATRPAFMGQGRPRGFVKCDTGFSQSALQNPQSANRTRAMSIQLAQAAQGGNE